MTVQKKRQKEKIVDPSSFRDPSGFVYKNNGDLFRQIESSYLENYNTILDSGLYNSLIDKNFLIPHKEVLKKDHKSQDKKVIKPKLIPYITYPYEWPFSLLKEAALLTLDIQKLALKRGMSLKDASAFNVQLIDGKPIFIDTLSFEKHVSKKPWIAYRQFCEHFLVPLALMTRKDISLNRLLILYLDGIPISLGSKLLPLSTYFSFPMFMHIHLQSFLQRYQKLESNLYKKSNLNKQSILLLVDNLKSVISGLDLKNLRSEWSDYRLTMNYSKKSLKSKKEIVTNYLNLIKPHTVMDIGANTGEFSRIAGKIANLVISIDSDPIAVELNYRKNKKNKLSNIISLVIDINNSSPNIGWSNEERLSLLNRKPVDTALVLAITHHLTLGNNVPFGKIAQYLSTLCTTVIIEFASKKDSKVIQLLDRNEVRKNYYSREIFEEKFSKYFKILSKTKVQGSLRTIYLMRSLKN